MSGWWQQSTWRTAASCQISSWWHLSYTFATKDCKLHVSLTQTHASIYSLSLHKPQCTFNLSPARLRVNAEKHLLPIVAQREDPSLLWDRKFSGMGSICHSCHQSQRVKVTEHLAWRTSPQIPVSPSGIFLRWYQRQYVTDEAITGLSLGSSCYLGALKTAAMFWK